MLGDVSTKMSSQMPVPETRVLMHVQCDAECCLQADEHQAKSSTPFTYLRWPLVGSMQWQLGFLTVSCHVSAKIQPCTEPAHASVMRHDWQTVSSANWLLMHAY